MIAAPLVSTEKKTLSRSLHSLFFFSSALREEEQFIPIMLSNSPLLLHLRVALLTVVHFAADAEEKLSRGARRLRWSLRDRIEEAASALAPVSSSALLRGSARILSVCVQLLTLGLSPISVKLHGRRRTEATEETFLSLTTKTMASLNGTAKKKQQQQQLRGRPPPRPATEAAVILAEADEAELPLGRVADVLEW